VGAALLETLFAPLGDGSVVMPTAGRSLFLRAQATPFLHRFSGGLVCEQSFKPFADALMDAGVDSGVAEENERFDLVMVLPSRQRDETRSLLVQAATRVSVRGTILTVAANSEGARSLQDDAARLFGPVHSISKHKCRAVWSDASLRRLDTDLADAWTQAAAPRLVPGTALYGAPGVFSWDRIDPGSALLAAYLPADLQGRGADLGAGWGYLSAQVLQRCAGVETLHLYEAERMALDLAQRNLSESLNSGSTQPGIEYFWHDVRRGLQHEYDFVISNPPFHVGRADEPDLGRQFIRAAAAALRPGGRFWMVANRHLPYENELRRWFAHGQVHAENGGFKVIEARRGDA
jgi:16S rRNA (guanine1207-N2)-methyltransferase